MEMIKKFTMEIVPIGSWFILAENYNINSKNTQFLYAKNCINSQI